MTYRFGTFQFDDESSQLLRHGRPVPLERQPARVLAVLLARAGEVVPRETLRDVVWGHETHVDFDRGLAYCLSHIRTALGDRGDNPRFIQTLPRRGYTFIAPVTPEPAASARAREADPAPAPTQVQAGEPPPAHGRRAAIAAMVVLALLAVVALVFARRDAGPVLVAVSVFDNETGVAEFDRPVAAMSDRVVASLANLAPSRLAVISNAEVLRQPRNIRNLKAVADGVGADYVLLGQLQHEDEGLRFITHVIRLRDMAHLKANRLHFSDGMAGVEAAVVSEFERAAREHLLTPSRN